MRIVWLALALSFCLSGCLFSLDGSLVTRPRDSSAKDARVERVDRGPGSDVAPDTVSSPETAPSDTSPAPQ